MAFWEEKTLQQMSRNEWESLCDGCGKCCLHKLHYEDSDEIVFTRVACHLLDSQCRCSNYDNRLEIVPDCLNLGPDNIHQTDALPDTCAYRLLAEGKNLPEWHPLMTADKNSVHTAGVSVRGQFISENFVHPDGLDEHIIDWIKAK